MTGSKLLGIVFGVIALMSVVFVVMLLVVKLLWAWTVPDLFPGAVEQGLVAKQISWLAAVKIALVVAVLSAFTRNHGRCE
jgi:hypothetical protein